MKKILLSVVLILFGITTQLTAQISALYNTPIASTAENPVWFFIQNATHFGVLELGETGTSTVSFAAPLTSNNERQLWRFEKDANGKFVIYNKGRGGRFSNTAEWVESGGTELFTITGTAPNYNIKPANNYLFNTASTIATLNTVASSSGNNVLWRFINAPTSSTSGSPVWYQWQSLRTTATTINVLQTSILKWTSVNNPSNLDQRWRFETTTNGYKISNRTENTKYLHRSGNVGTASNVTSSDANFTTFVLSPRSDASGSLLISEYNTNNRTDYIYDGIMGLYDRPAPDANQHHTIRGFLNVAPTIGTAVAGSYPGTQVVNISLPASEVAQIAYTTDGTDPSTSTTRILSSSTTNSVNVTIFADFGSQASTTIKACAVKVGFYASSVSTATFTQDASQTWYHVSFTRGRTADLVLQDNGEDAILTVQPIVLGADNQLWKIEAGTNAGYYKFTSKAGRIIYWDGTAKRYKAKTGATAQDLKFYPTTNTTYPNTFELQRNGITNAAMNPFGGSAAGREMGETSMADGGNCMNLFPLPFKVSDATNTYWYKVRDNRPTNSYWTNGTYSTYVNSLMFTTSSLFVKEQFFKFMKAPSGNGYLIYNNTNPDYAYLKNTTAESYQATTTSGTSFLIVPSPVAGRYIVKNETGGNQLNSYGGGSTGRFWDYNNYDDLGNQFAFVETPAPAYSGNALNMNGVNNYMRIPHNAAFNFSNTEEFSVTLWVNSTDLVAARNARIVAKRGDGSSTNKTAYEIWGLNTTANYYAVNTTKGESDNTALFSKWSSISANANTWVHLAFTVTGTGTNRDIRMYLNGQLAGSSKADAIDASNYTVSNAFDVTIGWGQYGGGYVQGKMDNIRFWNKGLTSSEVEADRFSTVTSSTPNLIAAYDFETIDLNAMTVADTKGTYTANLEGYSALTASVEQFGMSGRGNTNDPILRATVTVSATDAVGQPLAAVNLNNAILNLTGTTSLSDITSLKVYSTGTNVNFDPRDPITKGAVLLGSCSPAAGDISCTLSGTLAAGTNYLWITADIANNAVEGNQIDIALKSITAGSTHTLAANNPTGTTNIMLARKLILAPGDAGSANYRIPAVITANDGSVIVFTDKRKNNNSDLPEDIDVVAHRSTDNGKTWSAATTIAQGTGVGAGFGDVATVKTKTGKIIALFAGGTGFGTSTSSNPIKVYKSESTDNGISWSAPTDITSQLYAQGCSDPTRATWSGLFIASGQMLYTSTGRIMAVGLVRGDGSGTNNNYIVYSDDDGETWNVSMSRVMQGGDEAKIMELADGTFMVTSRKGGTAGRLKATSADGLTWTDTSSNISKLVEPGCNGDFVRYSKAGESATGNILLHSIPNNASSRRNVSVFYSTNEGTSWTLGKSIVPEMANNGLSGYSGLTVLADGTIGAYVEVENYSRVYELVYMNFSLGWLTGGAQTFTPVYNLLGADDVTANYSSWANSSNQGCGFGAWTLASGGNAGFFLGDPSAAGITAGLPNPSFALYANTTGSDYANADRAFVAPLSIGSTLSVTWGVNCDANGSGNKGINLYTGGVSGAQIININMGSSAVITINGNTMFSNCGTSAITLNFEYKSAGQLRVYATGRDGSEVYDQTFAVTGAPDAIRFYASGLNTGVQCQPYFNNLKIVTDPSKIPAGSRVFVKGCAELAKNSEVIDLTIASGNTLAVNAGKQLTVSTGLTNNGTLTLKSDATGTATILSPATITSGIGAVYNVQQYLTGNADNSARQWWYVSSPVSSAKSSVFDPAGTNNMGYYDETLATPAYVQFTANDQDLKVGTGYVTQLKSTGTFTFTGGTLNNGDITLTPTRTGTTAAKRGFNLVGNPYPSYLNWDAAYTATVNPQSNMRNAIWYRTYSGGAMVFNTYANEESVPLGANGMIPPMQAFWVKVKADGRNGSITFKNAYRSHATGSTFPLKAKALTEKQSLRLVVSNGVNTDETLIVGKSYASAAYDEYDAEKMSNDNAAIPEIYSMVENQELVINSVDQLTEGKTVTLGFRPGQTGTNFTIEATQLDNIDAKVMLLDKVAGTEQELTGGIPYTFTVTDAAATTDRFVISLVSRVPTGIETGTSSGEMTVYTNRSNRIQVIYRGELNDQTAVSVYNVAGQMLSTQKLVKAATELSGTFRPGVYMIQLTDNGKKITQKLIIK